MDHKSGRELEAPRYFSITGLAAVQLAAGLHACQGTEPSRKPAVDRDDPGEALHTEPFGHDRRKLLPARERAPLRATAVEAAIGHALQLVL